MVRPLAHVPGDARVRAELNPEQLAAIEATGDVFVSAGAGTGKTSVLVERFVRAVCDQGIDVDSILVITYTRKAASELRSRIKAALQQRGRYDLARELDSGWVSTIHGFCLRLLRSHPLTLGLDPRFREIDEAQGSVLRAEAFEQALTAFCSVGDPERVRLLATYGSASLRRMLTSTYETLRSAGRGLELELGVASGIGEPLRQFRAAAAQLADDPGSTELQRASAQQALVDVVETAPVEQLLDLGALRSQGPRALTYEEARKRLQQSALEELASRDRSLLQELLHGFANAYAEAKARESALDFEDLQLLARDLLRDHEDVRLKERERFRVVMVDEFQDTNRLQCELIDLLTGGPGFAGDREVFTVGDEFQSIYRFRHADVSVFRERRSVAEKLVSLTRNYRSRGSVLDAVNHLFTTSFGDDFEPLAASGSFDEPTLGHAVELLVVDKTSYRESPDHWRRAEARAIAERVRELVDSGAARPGEIVLLFAAGTAAELYEEELRRAGLPTYRATGRGYFGQQQVADLLAYLRLLRNRYDDVALTTVLASPLVGVSNDALALIRRAAGRRPLTSGIERHAPDGLDGEDERLIRAFRQRYERLVALSSSLSLEQLCDRIIAEHDYDLAVLAHPDGRRRYANLRKLGRLARSYEELRGRDLEGFLTFVRNQDALGAREQEAVAMEEDADAVRLLTIHSAKGLEFPVVIVADAGRDGPPPGPDEILTLPDGRFGFRVVHPASGDRHGVFAYDEVKEEAAEAERAERDRLYYVAMTRAIDRLIVCGSIDPARNADRETPIGWVLDRLNAYDDVASAVADQPVELVRGDARVLVRVERWAAAPTHLPAATTREEPLVDGPLQLALFADLPERVEEGLALELPPLAPIAEPPLHLPHRLSFTSLALFERCGYRYFAERIAGMRPEAFAGGDELRLAPTDLGDAVHRVLERLDLTSPSVLPHDQLEQMVRGWHPRATPGDIDRVALHVSAYVDSALARHVATLDDARPEQPFSFAHEGVLVRGRFDVLARSSGEAFVLDFKTNVLEGRDPAEVVAEDYELQRTVYALACLRAGDASVDVVFQFLEQPDRPVVSTFTHADLSRLELRVGDAFDRIRAGVFEPRPSEYACAGCPALDRVCAGLGLMSRGAPALLPHEAI